MSPGTSSCVRGSRAIWPETNTNPFARTACEYGPIALGPKSVAIASFTLPSRDLPQPPRLCPRLLFLSRFFARSKLRGKTRVVEPGVEYAGEIPPRFPFHGRPQFV